MRMAFFLKWVSRPDNWRGRCRSGWLALLLWPCVTQALPSYHAVRDSYRSADAVLLDRHGVPLQRVRQDMSIRRGEWITLQQVSPALRLALIVSEDKRFYAHSGVDWQAVSAAAWGNLWHTRTRGASTVTMQLAGLLDEDWRYRSGGRSMVQKLGQAATALRLEQSWRKDQILEAYLNLLPFRGELVGVDALSQGLFAKHPNGLNWREAAIAAVLVRQPNAQSGVVAQRACALLRDMQVEQECVGLEGFTLSTFLQARRGLSVDTSLREGEAPHLANRVFAASRGATGLAAGQRVRSTLDADLQRFATVTLQRQLRELATRHVEDGAVLVLDNASGEVLAWVGSSGALSVARHVDGVTALRQAGSTLKPFLYALAIEERRLTAASLLDDSPIDLQTGGGLYVPQNYDNGFKGLISLRTALASSLNVPAVRTLVMVTPRSLHRQLVALGLPLRESGDYYGYSLALGSADVSLLSLANAYRTLANGGRYSEPRWLWQPAKPADASVRLSANRQVISAQASYIIGDILSDRHARTRTFGLDSPLGTRFWTAVKTGTSKDMRDNWCIGWSSRYTVGVWVGNASGEPMWDVSGVSGAAPIWHAVMTYLHADRRSLAPSPPAGLQQQAVHFAGEIEPARQEWFLGGTAVQNVVPVVTEHVDPWRITEPQDGSLLALDPDIPPQHQRVWLQSPARQAVWYLDGKRLGRGRRLAWLPQPGRHRLELRDVTGKVRDWADVEVRGAGLKPQASAPVPESPQR